MPGKSYLNLESYKKQIERVNVKYPVIDEFLNSDALIDRIKDLEIKSIKNFKEDLFIRCGNKMFKPLTLRETENKAIFISNPKEIETICKDDPHSLVHFHGIAHGYHSTSDKITHENMFRDTYANDGTVVGIDGIHIQTYLNHNIRIPWSDEFYKELKKIGVNVIHNVKGIFCNRIDKKSKECTIYVKNGLPSIRNIFHKIYFEDPSLESAFYPFRSLDENTKNMIHNIDYNGKNTTCVIMTHKNKRYLSCFNRE